MQFFPVAQDILHEAAETVKKAASAIIDPDNGSFGNVLSSFMEEGRTDYTGRPAGFAAFGVTSGTLGETEGSLLKKALRKRNASELSIEALEQLMNSGTPVTVGTIFNTLSGNTRLGATLEGDERDTFKVLLGKLGFTKDDVESMISMSDDADMRGMMRMLLDKLGALDGEVDLDRKEFASLLNGLDVSSATKKALLQAFEQEETYSLNREQLDAMLIKVKAELNQREEASAKTRLLMRGAIEEALENAKRQEQMAAIEDKRGNRRSEQTEEFMKNSVLKRSGALDGLQDESSDDGTEQDFLNRKDDPKNRAERILATLTEKADEKTKTATTAPKLEVSNLLHRIDVAQNSMPQANPTGMNQNLETVAKNFRQEIFSQVENGILQNMQNGTQRLTLQLNPGELGQVTLVVSMQQGELRATIRAEQPESASVLREHMAELKASLEAEGIKVKDLDVQTGLRDSDFGRDFTGTGDHNFMHDTQERDRMLRLTRIRREAGMVMGGSGSAQALPLQTEDSGLHIVA